MNTKEEQVTLREHLSKIGKLRWKNPKNKKKNDAHIKKMQKAAKKYWTGYRKFKEEHKLDK